MQVRIISFTDRGQQLAELLADRLCGTATRCGRDCSLAEWVRDAFDSADALIYVGAVGICVRTIAPYIKSKTRDPAVVVIDETGKYVTSAVTLAVQTILPAALPVLRGRNRSSRQQQILPMLFRWMRGRGYRDVLWRIPDG